MPGISLLLSSEGMSNKIVDALETVSGQLLHFPGYLKELIHRDEKVFICSTGYESYPLLVIRSENSINVLEGIIYNQDKLEIKGNISDIARKFCSNQLTNNDLQKFIENSDGEFVLTVYDKVAGNILIVNDMFGRLPVYYYSDGNVFTVSREIKFIFPFLDTVALSKKALMGYLLYGFPLGNETLIKNIRRLTPATSIRYDGKSSVFLLKEIVPFNIEKKLVPRAVVNNEENIESMKRLFLDGLGNRVGKLSNKKSIISLSGGLDSRATLAGLSLLNITPDAVSNPGRENIYARRIARQYNLNFHTLNTEGGNASFQSARSVVLLKDGLNSVDVGHVYDNLSELYEMYGSNVVVYTGMFGGELLRYSNIISGLPDKSGLIRFLLSGADNYMIPSEDVAKLLFMKEEDMYGLMDEHLSGYKESDIYRKYVRFKYEKDFKMAGEGEDRYRFFFWTVTPFYSTEFFNYVISINEKKKNSLLFRNFLCSLDPQVCNVPYYNYKISLNNSMMIRLLAVSETLVRYPSFRKAAKGILNMKSQFVRKRNKSSVVSDPYITELIKLIFPESIQHLEDYFSIDAIRELVIERGNPTLSDRILTILILLESVENTYGSQRPE